MIGLMDKMMNAMTGSMSADDKQNTMLKMMPQMMKSINTSDITELLTKKSSNIMFKTFPSRFGYKETIEKILEAAKEFGWYNPQVNDHYEIEQNFELENPNRVATVSMCLPRSAYTILKENKRLAAMMPLQITVFEEDGEIFISWMNIQMMGKMFGATVSEAMGTAEEMLKEAHKNIIKA